MYSFSFSHNAPHAVHTPVEPYVRLLSYRLTPLWSVSHPQHSSASKQKSLSTSHLYLQLDPFALKLLIYYLSPETLHDIILTVPVCKIPQREFLETCIESTALDKFAKYTEENNFMVWSTESCRWGLRNITMKKFAPDHTKDKVSWDLDIGKKKPWAF